MSDVQIWARPNAVSAGEYIILDDCDYRFVRQVEHGCLECRLREVETERDNLKDELQLVIAPQPEREKALRDVRDEWERKYSRLMDSYYDLVDGMEAIIAERDELQKAMEEAQ